MLLLQLNSYLFNHFSTRVTKNYERFCSMIFYFSLVNMVQASQREAFQPYSKTMLMGKLLFQFIKRSAFDSSVLSEGS